MLESARRRHTEITGRSFYRGKMRHPSPAGTGWAHFRDRSRRARRHAQIGCHQHTRARAGVPHRVCGSLGQYWTPRKATSEPGTRPLTHTSPGCAPLFLCFLYCGSEKASFQKWIFQTLAVIPPLSMAGKSQGPAGVSDKPQDELGCTLAAWLPPQPS